MGIESSSKAKNDMKTFIEQLKGYGLSIKKVTGDGNCLFRAISDQMEGTESYHLYYRKKAIKYMETHSDYFNGFIEDNRSFSDYVKKMSKDGFWGGNLEIYAISMAFKVNFYIYQFEQPMLVVKNFDNPDKVLMLSYHKNEHYNSVRKIESDHNNKSTHFTEKNPLELINQIEHLNI